MINRDDDLSQISQPLSKATLQLVQAALHLENAQQALQRAMRLSPEFRMAYDFEWGRINNIIAMIRLEVSK